MECPVSQMVIVKISLYYSLFPDIVQKGGNPAHYQELCGQSLTLDSGIVVLRRAELCNQ